MSRVLVAMIGVTAACGRVDFDTFDRGSSGDAARCEVTSGLIGYWPMNAGDVTASTVFDRSGAGLDGTMMGMPAPVVGAGRIGEALDFSGTTLSWVELPPIPFDATPGAFNTVAMWLRTDNPNLDESPIYLPYVFGPPRYDIWFTAQTLGPVSLCINDGENSCWGTTDPALIGRWVHLVAVFANGTIDQGSVFIDGAPVNSTCRFGPCDRLRSAQNPVTIGGPDSRYGWHGLVDDLRIYNRALTPAEIQSLYSCP